MASETKESSDTKAIASTFLKALLNQTPETLQHDSKFTFSSDQIIALTKECLSIVKEQPILLKVEAPVKVFGDLFGEFKSLTRYFEVYGKPTEEGDIESTDYLFLGNYVDRGYQSLETICLLMALKITYPDKIHLLRGNHEDRDINLAYGFEEECERKLGTDYKQVFTAINDVFDWLPLAGVVDGTVICLHGGIGRTLTNVN